ncbi:MAG TPA: hypothetical protein DEB39_06930, partial [Planctomycetaceae bacterium]|nr:hypothetical protein [Planctomycetaceae bacterium]
MGTNVPVTRTDQRTNGLYSGSTNPETSKREPALFAERLERMMSEGLSRLAENDKGSRKERQREYDDKADRSAELRKRDGNAEYDVKRFDAALDRERNDRKHLDYARHRDDRAENNLEARRSHASMIRETGNTSITPVVPEELHAERNVAPTASPSSFVVMPGNNTTVPGKKTFPDGTISTPVSQVDALTGFPANGSPGIGAGIAAYGPEINPSPAMQDASLTQGDLAAGMPVRNVSQGTVNPGTLLLSASSAAMTVFSTRGKVFEEEKADEISDRNENGEFIPAGESDGDSRNERKT